jgi:hypothetical protein
MPHSANAPQAKIMVTVLVSEMRLQVLQCSAIYCGPLGNGTVFWSIWSKVKCQGQDADYTPVSGQWSGANGGWKELTTISVTQVTELSVSHQKAASVPAGVFETCEAPKSGQMHYVQGSSAICHLPLPHLRY